MVVIIKPQKFAGSMPAVAVTFLTGENTRGPRNISCGQYFLNPPLQHASIISWLWHVKTASKHQKLLVITEMKMRAVGGYEYFQHFLLPCETVYEVWFLLVIISCIQIIKLRNKIGRSSRRRHMCSAGSCKIIYSQKTNGKCDEHYLQWKKHVNDLISRLVLVGCPVLFYRKAE